MMGDKVLVKADVTQFQTVGQGGPSIRELGRAAFGPNQGGSRMRSLGRRAAGAAGLVGAGLAAAATALSTADAMQGGNIAAPLGAGYTYQGLNPAGQLTQQAIAPTPTPTPTYDYTQSSFPVNQFVQNTGVSPTGQSQPVQPVQPQVGYGAGSPTLGQTVQAPQAQAPPAQAQAPPAQQPPVDNSHLPPVAISTQPPVPMGSAQADVMRTPATANPTDGTLNTGAMMGSGGFVPTQAATMDERSNQLQSLAPVHVRQPIQQQPIQQQPIQQQTNNIDPAMRAYLESIKQPFTDTNKNDIMSEEEAYERAWGKKSEFTDMLFDLLGPDTLYKMTPNEIGELAAFMYIKTR